MFDIFLRRHLVTMIVIASFFDYFILLSKSEFFKQTQEAMEVLCEFCKKSFFKENSSWSISVHCPIIDQCLFRKQAKETIKIIKTIRPIILIKHLE